MGKYISGTLQCRIEFHYIYVEDGQDELDALFPEGWEGEMLHHDLKITEEIDEDDA